MSESFASILERGPPPEDAILNETLHNVVVKALGESYMNRKITAQTFLKNNEKSNILAKTRIINYNLNQIRSRLALNMSNVTKNTKILNETNENDKPESKERINKKKLKSLMFSNELWGNKHYQQVIEDSFLMPKLDLNTAKQQSFYLKELTSKYSTVYQRIHNSKAKRKEFLNFLNDSFQGIIAKKIDPHEFLAKKGSLTLLKDYGRRPSKQEMLAKIARASSLKVDQRSNSEKSPRVGGLLEEVVKRTVILNKCNESQTRQKAKDDFFRQLIDKNIGNDTFDANQIEKAREIRNKLVSTYHYAKHKRGKNPFSMLVTGKKEVKSKGIVGEVLQKTQKKAFGKTFHFMAPLEKNNDEKKKEEKVEENKNVVRQKSMDSSNFSKNSESSIDLENDRKKFRKKRKPKIQKREYDSIELKQVYGVIMQECDHMIQDDLNLKREIDVGLNLKELESYVDANPELKEARIIREIKRFQSEVQRKSEGLKRSISENGLKK